MKPQIVIKTLICLCLIFSIFSCSVENSGETPLSQETARLSVDLRAFQGAYDHLSLDIQDVLIKVIDDESVPGCWLSLNSVEGIYDLSENDDGSFINLVSELNVPAGMIYEVQLVLGNENSILIDGVNHHLATPSVHQTGRSTTVDVDFMADGNYGILIDFNVDESILLTNTPDYIILKPTLTASTFIK